MFRAPASPSVGFRRLRCTLHISSAKRPGPFKNSSVQKRKDIVELRKEGPSRFGNEVPWDRSWIGSYRMKTRDLEIKNVTQELIEVQKALNVFREKQKNRESLDEAAIEFVTKADLVIQRAERKEIFLTEDQKRRIKNNLLRIRSSLVRNQAS